jgi:hypothetical protein
MRVIAISTVALPPWVSTSERDPAPGSATYPQAGALPDSVADYFTEAITLCVHFSPAVFTI